MTPTQIEVTEEQYNGGSSARCHCGVINYFLAPLVDVSYQWSCCACGEYNFHPCHQQSRDKIKEMRGQLEQMRQCMDLSIVTSEDEPKHNHQFTTKENNGFYEAF